VGIGRLDDSINGIKLDRGQWDAYSQLAGQLTYQRLSDVVNAPEFFTTPPEKQIQMIHRSISVAREAARAIIKSEYPEIPEKATENKNKMIYGE
jgi:hypothetical protein